MIDTMTPIVAEIVIVEVLTLMGITSSVMNFLNIFGTITFTVNLNDIIASFQN